MTQKNRADLGSQITTLFADNTTGDITPADLRAVSTDNIDSALNILTDSSDDITQGSTNLFFTSAEQTKLAGIDTSATANPNAVDSDISGITGADAITNIVSLTQAEYDAIVTPNTSTLYIITDAI